MTGQGTRTGVQKGLDAMNGRVTQTASTRYLCLLSAAPSTTTTLSTMTEVSTAGYARQAAAWGAATSADPRVAANTGLITFGPFSADPPNIPYAGLATVSSGTAGDLDYIWTLDTPRDAASGDSIQVAIGALTMSL